MSKKFTLVAGAGLMSLMAACSAPAPQAIYAEPVFDKYGAPSCRPPSEPVGGIYTADLPLCALISGADATATAYERDHPGGVIDPVDPVVPVDPVDPVDPETGPPNQNQNQNQNRNSNG